MAKMNAEQLRNNVIARLNKYEGLLRTADMANEAVQIADKVKEYLNGLFSVMFTGDFNVGKSTTLNALMRQQLLKASINPETPVITKIVNGSDSDYAVIKYRDKDRPDERIPLEQFAEKYRLEFQDEGKFVEVSYVELTRKLRTSTVAFVDSPGLGNNTTDDAAANEFAEKADAIVFMIHATKAMDQAAEDYIERRFRRRHLKNVFFIVNWYNAVPEQDEEKFRERIRHKLYDVFTDEDGNFNQALYDSRVFFVDAFTSLCARTGTPKKVRKGARWIETSVDAEEDAYSGIPEFEQALYEYLEADDRDLSGYQGFMPCMAGMLSATCEHINEVVEQGKQSLDSLKQKEKNQETAIAEIKKYLGDIQQAVDACVSEMLVNAQSAYNSYIMSIENNWDEYFKGNKIAFGVKDEFKIFGLKMKHKVQDIFDRDNVDKLARDKEFEKLMEPIMSQIEKYIRKQTEKMVSKLTVDCEPAVKRMCDRVQGDAACIRDIELPGFDFDKLVRNVLASSKKNVGNVTKSIGKNATGVADTVNNDMSIAQMLISGVLLFNFDDMVTGGVDGKKPWGTFLKENLLKEIGDEILALVIASVIPYAWIYYLARAVWGVLTLKKNAEGIGNTIVLGMKGTVKQMTMDAKDEVLTNIESHFNNEIQYGFGELIGSIELGMTQKQKQLGDLIRLRESKEFDEDKKKAELLQTKSDMIATFNDLSTLLGGSSYTEEQILAMATQKA